MSNIKRKICETRAPIVL